MRIILGLINVLSVPVAVLNFIGGITAVIWLMVLGEWKIILNGVFLTAFSSFVIGIALMPGMLLSVPALAALEKGKKILGIILGLFASLYTYVLMAAWAMYSFFSFMNKATYESYIPIMLLSYMVATSPWVYMSSKEDNPYSNISSFFCCVSYIGVMFSVLFFKPTFLEIIQIFSGPMVFILLFTSYLSYLVDKEGCSSDS